MSTTPFPEVRLYEPGRDVTAEATAAVTLKKFVKIAGDRATGGNIAVPVAAAGDRAFGVAGENAGIGELVRVVRGGIVKVIAGADITAAAEVQVGAGGTVITKAAGIAVGYAITGATSGHDAQIVLH